MHPHLSALLNPRSIAVVGANDKGNVGARTLQNVRDAGFQGPLYPINPNYDALDGLTCYPSLAALPEVPDAVVVSVPVAGALKVLEEAAAVQIPAAVLFSEGFADAGTEEGQLRNTALLKFAGESGMAISGPNSMGILSRARHYAASFMRLPKDLKTGGISVISQSGGLTNALTELGRNRGLGFNYLISAGNEAVINAADYLEWLAEDAGTNVIVAIVEGIKDGPRFRAALTHAAAKKPVVVLKLGLSELGGRATLAHTGSLAGGDKTFHALCRQAGVIVADTLDSLLETAAMLEKAPLPRGDRAVIFSTSGGATVLTADLGSAAGLRFPPLNPATNQTLQKILEVERPFTNPFDVVGNPRIVKGDNMTRCLETLIADDGVDLIGFVLVMQRDPSAQRQKLLDQIEAVSKTTTKPIIILPEMTFHWRDAPPDPGVPVAGTLADGLKAMRALVEVAARRSRSLDPAPDPLPLSLVPPSGRGVLTEFESKRALSSAGLPVTRETLAQNLDGAMKAAAEIGYPVALKVQAPDLIHKSDAGGLVLGINDEEALRLAFGRLDHTFPACDGILVQEMIEGGQEVLIGMHRDPALGPVVVFGPGGVLVDLLGETMVMSLPPFGRVESAALIERSTPADKLLSGFRGAPAGDRAALTDLLYQFGALVAGLGADVAAIDLNPVIVRPDGQGVVIIDATIEFTSK
jgi:acyl-CoA synthetase (NDP forming)